MKIDYSSYYYLYDQSMFKNANLILMGWCSGFSKGFKLCHIFLMHYNKKNLYTLLIISVLCVAILVHSVEKNSRLTCYCWLTDIHSLQVKNGQFYCTSLLIVKKNVNCSEILNKMKEHVCLIAEIKLTVVYKLY